MPLCANSGCWGIYNRLDPFVPPEFASNRDSISAITLSLPGLYVALKSCASRLIAQRVRGVLHRIEVP